MLGRVAQLDVALLGDPGQGREGLLGGQLVPLHEDALGLTDQVAGDHCGAQVLLGLRAAQRHRRLRGERQPLAADLRVERLRLRA